MTTCGFLWYFFQEKQTEDLHIMMCTDIMNHNFFLSLGSYDGYKHCTDSEPTNKNTVPTVNQQIKVVLGINIGNQHNLTMLCCDGHKQTYNDNIVKRKITWIHYIMSSRHKHIERRLSPTCCKWICK